MPGVEEGLLGLFPPPQLNTAAQPSTTHAENTLRRLNMARLHSLPRRVTVISEDPADRRAGWAREGESATRMAHESDLSSAPSCHTQGDANKKVGADCGVVNAAPLPDVVGRGRTDHTRHIGSIRAVSAHRRLARLTQRPLSDAVGAPSEPKHSAAVTLTAADNGKDVDVVEGEAIALRLASATAGQGGRCPMPAGSMKRSKYSAGRFDSTSMMSGVFATCRLR